MKISNIYATVYYKRRKVLDVNKQERHIRGGLATWEKYLHQYHVCWLRVLGKDLRFYYFEEK